MARLIALAIHFDQLIRDGVVADQAELAKMGRVTRARVTQIMNLLDLAPEIQEHLLLDQERRSISERRLRPVAAASNWRQQRRLWAALASAPD